MGNGNKTFENCMEENVKQYRLDDLLDKEKIRAAFVQPAEALGIRLLLTCRHGEPFLSTSGCGEGDMDVTALPGEKLKVQGRTVGHVYADFSQTNEAWTEALKNWYRGMLTVLTELLGETYLRKEAQNYISELDSVPVGGGEEKRQEKTDSLTGVYNKSYFISRMNVIERSEVVPVALIQANINDTKFFFDTYGEDAGNRLLCIVANALKQCAKKEYIIGRWGVDVFHILIPLPDEGEADDYCERVKAAVWACEDEILAPSVAMGTVYKTNVEESFTEKLSDVEFEMLSDKMHIKHQPGYEERKNKGLKKQ